MVRFIRIRGRIIPIIQKAVAKGSGYFGRATKMKSHEQNIKALKTIRQGLKKGNVIGSGQESVVYGFKGKAIKRLNDNIPNFRIERRFAAENALSRIGHAPKGHLVHTKSRSYIIQDKVNLTAEQLYERTRDSSNYNRINSHKVSSGIGSSISKAESIAKKRFDIDGIDAHWGNWGFSGKSSKAKLLDGGFSGFDMSDNKYFPIRNSGSRALWRFNENKAKLMARSKTIGRPE